MNNGQITEPNSAVCTTDSGMYTSSRLVGMVRNMTRLAQICQRVLLGLRMLVDLSCSFYCPSI